MKSLRTIFHAAAVVTLSCVFSLFAQNPNLGTSGAKFLSISAGTRGAAMGGAVVGSIDDASSVFWNPAGLTGVTGTDVRFSTFKWFEMYDMSSGALAYNLEGVGVIGAQFISFTTGKIEITTEKQPNGTGRYYDAGDFALGLSFARALTDRFSVGVSAKYIYQRIWNETADGLAFDIGTQYRIDFNNLTIAMSLANFGGDLRYDGPDLNITLLRDDEIPLSRLAPGRLSTNDYPLPLNFQVGIGIDLFTYGFVSARGGVDVVHPNDNTEQVNTGIELSFFDRLFLRGGYRFNRDIEKASFGAGATLPLGESVILFDYSYTMYDILPDVQRISFGVSF